MSSNKDSASSGEQASSSDSLLRTDVTAVNLSPVRLDQHGKRSTLSCLDYENSCLP